MSPSLYLDRVVKLSCALSNHYQASTVPYILEPWCVPTSINKGLILVPKFSWVLEVSLSNPNMIIRSINSIITKLSQLTFSATIGA